MRDLLLLLCQYPFHVENREILSYHLKEIRDWKPAIELINAHGIIALAAYNIKEAGLEKELPEQAMSVIENGYRQSMVRNLWLAERWKEVNSVLSKAGVKHVLLKGMALEHTVYESKGLRQMTDNDILIKKDDALLAWNILQEHGFSPEILKSRLHKKILLHAGKHLPSLFKDGYTIEIHYRLFESEKNASDDQVDNAVEISVSGTPALILPKEIHIKYLSEHLKRHFDEGGWQLRMYMDIKMLDDSYPVDIPEDFVMNPFQEDKKHYIKTAYRLELQSIPSRYRLRFIVGDIFPSVEWMKNRYKCSRAKALLYYPMRIGKLVWLVGRGVRHEA